MKVWPFFQIIFTLALIGIQFFFLRNITHYLRSRERPVWTFQAVLLTFIGFNLPLIILSFWRPNLFEFPRWAIVAGVYPFYIWHFCFALLFFIIMAGKVLKVPFLSAVWIMSKFERTEQWLHSFRHRAHTVRFDSRRRAVVRQGLTVLAGATFGGATYGAFLREHYELTEVSVPIKNLPKDFEGFTIALASDIHSSVFMTKDQMQHYVGVINSLKADLITVTGDFVNGLLDEVYPFAEAFCDLRARYGAFGVLGNHDFYTRRVDTVARVIDDCGIRLLRNDHVTISKGSGQIHILGVDDVTTEKRAGQLFDVALSGTDRKEPSILLCHRPYFFAQAERRSIPLTLAGHTHGGQVVFARFGGDVIAPARVASPYVAGLYSINDSRMYVSRGIGTVGVPIRINCPPEVTRVTLRRS